MPTRFQDLYRTRHRESGTGLPVTKIDGSASARLNPTHLGRIEIIGHELTFRAYCKPASCSSSVKITE